MVRRPHREGFLQLPVHLCEVLDLVAGVYGEHPQAGGDLGQTRVSTVIALGGAGVEGSGAGSVTRSGPATAELVIFRQDCGNGRRCGLDRVLH